MSNLKICYISSSEIETESRESYLFIPYMGNTSLKDTQISLINKTRCRKVLFSQVMLPYIGSDVSDIKIKLENENFHYHISIGEKEKQVIFDIVTSSFI
jgi:hypothetical protein